MRKVGFMHIITNELFVENLRHRIVFLCNNYNYPNLPLVIFIFPVLGIELRALQTPCKRSGQFSYLLPIFLSCNPFFLQSLRLISKMQIWLYPHLKWLLLALRLNPRCSPGLGVLRSTSLYWPSWIPSAGCRRCPSSFHPASSTLLPLAVVSSWGLEENPCPGLHQQVHAMTSMEVSLPRALSSTPARRSGPSGPIPSSCFIFFLALHITR